MPAANREGQRGKEMSFLANMPSRNAANFSMMFSGDARAGGSCRQPATGITEYIALNDTRPPEGQAIGMCQGHSVLGYNWHQHVSCPTSDKQRGLKGEVSIDGGGGSVPRVSSTASASKTAVGSNPQSRNTRSAQGCGGDSIRSAASGSRDSAGSSCDNDNDVMRASSLSRHTATKAAVAEVASGEAVDSMMDPPISRDEERICGVGRSFGARGLLGGSRVANRGTGNSFSTTAGRGRREVSDSGEEGEPPEQAAVTAAAAATRGRVGMRKARRTYGR